MLLEGGSGVGGKGQGWDTARERVFLAWTMPNPGSASSPPRSLCVCVQDLQGGGCPAVICYLHTPDSPDGLLPYDWQRPKGTQRSEEGSHRSGKSQLGDVMWGSSAPVSLCPSTPAIENKLTPCFSDVVSPLAHHWPKPDFGRTSGVPSLLRLTFLSGPKTVPNFRDESVSRGYCSRSFWSRIVCE